VSVSGENLKPPFPTVTVWTELDELAVLVAAAAEEAEVVGLLPPPPYCARTAGRVLRRG